MKIAIATMQLGPGYRHGTEHYVESLGGELRDRGHAVRYLAGDPLKRGAGRSTLRDPDDIFRYPTSGWMAVTGESSGPIERWLAEWKPDVLHVANPAHVGVGAMRAARSLGIPVVVTAMDYWWICSRATLLHEGRRPCDGRADWRECLRCVSSDHPRRSMRALSRLPGRLAPVALTVVAANAMLRGTRPEDVARWTRRRDWLLRELDAADRLIFPSRAMRDAIAPLLGHGRWQMIPYGLAPSWFGDPRPTVQPGAACGLTIGFAGSLRANKGADLIVHAMRALGWNQTRLRIAGAPDDAGYQRELERSGRDLSLEFVGALSRSGMRDFLRTLDVLVVPSRWDENLPFVVLEAQAAGVEVIGSDVPGIAEQVPNARRRFERGSALDLARALREFAARPAPASRPFVSDLSEMATATEAIYRDVSSARIRPSLGVAAAAS